MEGAFWINRKIFENWVFADPKVLKIWIWLIGYARINPGYIPLKNGKGVLTIPLKRGQLIFGRNAAEEKLQIDGSTIYRILQKLKDDKMIEIEANNQYSIITICEYDQYQPQNENSEQPTNNQRTANEQPTSNQRTQYNKDNKDNNVNKDKENIDGSILNSFFDSPEIEKLYTEVLNFFPAELRPQSEKQKKDWSDTLKKLVDTDKYSPDHILKVISTARNDVFWSTNFLSVLKLRRKDKDNTPYFKRFEQLLNQKSKSTTSRIDTKRCNDLWKDDDRFQNPGGDRSGNQLNQFFNEQPNRLQ